MGGPGWMSRASPEVKATLCDPQVKWEAVEKVAQTSLKETQGDSRNAYGVSKATLMAFTSILVREHPSIATSTISPGFIDTAMTQGFGAPHARARDCLDSPLPLCQAGRQRLDVRL